MSRTLTTETAIDGYVVGPDEGASVRFGPTATMRVVPGVESTGGHFSVVEATEPPGSGAPLHVHRREAEAFNILAGEVAITCGAATVRAGAGSFVYAPPDVPHKYTVIGDEPLRMLLLFSRSGFESFFTELGTPLAEPPAGPPDPEKIQSISERYGVETLESFGH